MFKKGLLLSRIFFIVLFIALAFIIEEPIKQTFEYDVDEGIDLMAPVVMLKGFSLYHEIFKDHPPLITITLASWFKLFKPSVYHGRILISIFSCIFLFAFYQTIKNLWGSFCGIAAVIFLLLSSLYLLLGISIMIGTVSLSLAMLSIYCITLYKKHPSKYLLALSGIFFALSLQTKLITAFLIPLIVLEIIQARWTNLGGKNKLSHFLPPILLWFGSLLAVSLIFIAVFFQFNLSLIMQQLIQPHAKKLALPGCDFFIIWQMILSDYDIALLALLGVILLIHQKKWQYLLPVLWLGLAITALVLYKPIWEHYYTLVSIPICWLAAISLSQLFAGIQKKKNFFFWLTVAIIILVIVKIPGKYNRMLESIQVETAPEEKRIVNLLLKYKKDIHWIFTDRPIFAFYADILVPPELVLTSDRRNFTDSITQDYFINKIDKYKPEIIILNELAYFSPSAISYIKDNYTLLHKFTPHYYANTPDKPSLEIKLFMRLADYFLKFKNYIYQTELFRPKPDYKYFYRLLTKELQDKAGYFLAQILEEQIASEYRTITKENLDANPNLPFTLSKNGKFRLKPYSEVSKKWEEKLHDQSISFFAYQFFKKILKMWGAEQGKNAVSASATWRLQSLRERILEDIKKGQIIYSFNSRGAFTNPLTLYWGPSHKDIEFYVRKNSIKLPDCVSLNLP